MSCWSVQRGIVALVFLSLFLPHQACAGAWLLPENQWQGIYTLSQYRNDVFVNAGNLEQVQPVYEKITLNPYIEHGLTPWMTAGANLMLEQVSQDVPGQVENHRSGIGDSEFFLRYRLWQQDKAVLSIQPLLSLPSPANDSLPAIGSGDVALELRLLGGIALDDAGSFANLELAYRHRHGASGNQWRMDAAAGYQIHPNWQVLGQFFATLRTDRSTNNAAFIRQANDYDLIKGQVSGIYQLSSDWKLQIGAFRHLYARNTGEGDGILLAFWHTF